MSADPNNFDKWLTDSIMQYTKNPPCSSAKTRCEDLSHIHRMGNSVLTIITPQLLESIYTHARDVSFSIEDAKCKFLPNVILYRDKCMATLSFPINCCPLFTSREIIEQDEWVRFCTRVKPCDSIDLGSHFNMHDDKQKVRKLCDVYDWCTLDPYKINNVMTCDGSLIRDESIITHVLEGGMKVIKSTSVRKCHMGRMCNSTASHYNCYNGMYQWSCGKHRDDDITRHPYHDKLDLSGMAALLQQITIIDRTGSEYYESQKVVEDYVDDVILKVLMVNDEAKRSFNAR